MIFRDDFESTRPVTQSPGHPATIVSSCPCNAHSSFVPRFPYAFYEACKSAKMGAREGTKMDHDVRADYHFPPPVLLYMAVFLPALCFALYPSSNG
jgi:hypothetical protein